MRVQISARISVLIVAAAAVAAYWNTLANGFVYDDMTNVVANHWLTGVQHLPEIFSSHVAAVDARTSTSFYRPLMHVFLMASQTLFDPAPWGFHLVNVLLHAGCSVLVFLLASHLLAGLARWFGGVSAALLAALLFAVHPIHTESVAWISGITDLSSAFFWLLGLYLYVAHGRGESSGSRWCLALSVVSFFAAMLCKEIGVTLVVVVILYDLLQGPTSQRRPTTLWRWLPFAMVAVAYLGLRTWALQGFAPGVKVHELTPFETMLNIFPLIAGYAGKLLVPIGLSPVYPFSPAHSIADPRVISGALLAVAVAGGVVAARRSRVTLVAAAILIVPLLPALYIPSLGSSVFAERYLYLPSVGFVLLAVSALRRISDELPRAASVLALSCLLVLVSFFVATVSRNMDWRDDRTLWADAVRKVPGSAMAHENYGYGLLAAGLYDDAIAEYRTALELGSSAADTYANLGVAYAHNGDPGRAIAAYRSAIEARSDHAEAHLNLGLALLGIGRLDEAAEECRAALSFNARLSSAHHTIGVTHARKGEFAMSVERFRAATTLAPDNARYQTDLREAIALRDRPPRESAR